MLIHFKLTNNKAEEENLSRLFRTTPHEGQFLSFHNVVYKVVRVEYDLDDDQVYVKAMEIPS